MKKRILALIIAIMIVTVPVMADTTFTFRTPGNEEELQSKALDKIDTMMDIIKNDYYKDVEEEDLVNGAIKGMFDVLDPHSTYFSPEEYKEFMDDLNGEIVGIGVQIEKGNGGINVIAPIYGTPAYKAGLKTGDLIIKVDETNITDYSADQAAKLIRGEIGTKVKIGLIREGEADVIYFEFIRETIEIDPVKYEIKEGNIGYIRISEFSGKAYNSTAAAVKEFQKAGIEGAIIDLRGNPGGLLSEVVDICRLFIPQGPIVKIQVKNEIEEVYSSDLATAPFKLVVLTDRGSASASEIMAGAIRDSKTGIIVGEKTYGKGTVQQILKLDNGGGVKLTIANYLTPSNFSLDGIGINPDIEVKAETASKEEEYTAIRGDRSIKKGNIGLDVLGLQQRLNSLGYGLKLLDGIFGEGTRAAVLSFQRDNNLTQDASIDADDLKVLMDKFQQNPEQSDVQLNRAMEEIKKILSK